MRSPLPVQIPTDAGEMPAQLFMPDAGRGPGLVLFQEIFGVTDYIRQRASDLADLGYVVLVPEIYWRLADADIDESAPDYLERALGLMQQLDWQRAVVDGALAVAHLRDLPEADEVGVFGFCFGGGLAFAVAASSRPDALVSYYGSALPDLLDLAPRVTCPSLHHFGDADAYIPLDVVRRIESEGTKNPDCRFWIYPGAGHAFDNPRPEFHHADASSRAWTNTTTWLAETLPTQ